MEKYELIELIKKIQLSEDSEEESDNNIALLCHSVLDLNAADYIFYDDLNAEEIAEKILNYQPIKL